MFESPRGRALTGTEKSRFYHAFGTFEWFRFMYFLDDCHGFNWVTVSDSSYHLSAELNPSLISLPGQQNAVA